jgi:hypothetical protein
MKHGGLQKGRFFELSDRIMPANKPSRAAAKRQPFANPMALQTQLVLLLGRAELAASLNACQGLLEKLHRLVLFLGRHPARVKFEPEMW